MRSTSVEAYNTIRENGLLSKTRLAVYEILYSQGPLTGNQITQYVNRTQYVGSVKARLSELRDRGVAREVDTVADPITGHRVILWDVTDGLPIKVKKPKRVKCAACCGRGYVTEAQGGLF